MFNTNFDLAAILGRYRDYLEEPLGKFSDLTYARQIEYQGNLYVHALDLVEEGGSATTRLNKKFLSMPESTKLCIAKCPKCRHRCRLFQREIGVVVYLFLLAGYDDKDKTQEETPSDHAQGTGTPEISSPQSDLEEFLDEEEEKMLAKETSQSQIRSTSSIVDTIEISRCKGALPLPVLPSFPIDGKEYLLLSDIQRSLDLREDEALAILAQRWNFNLGTQENPFKYSDFVLPDPVLGDLNVCYDQSIALHKCFEDASKYKEPTKEEFDEARERLQPVVKPETEPSKTDGEPIIEEANSSKHVQGSIDIWQNTSLVPDENISVSQALFLIFYVFFLAYT